MRRLAEDLVRRFERADELLELLPDRLAPLAVPFDVLPKSFELLERGALVKRSLAFRVGHCCS